MFLSYPLFLTFSVSQAAMSSSAEVTSNAMSAVLSSALSAAVSSALADATANNAKTELTTLIDQWEEVQQGSTEELVSILTKWAFIYTLKS